MFKFLIGLILGVIAGAVAVILFSTMGSVANPFPTSVLAPGQAVVHISIDEAYLNQQLAAVLASQPDFRDASPQLDMQEPNVAALTADIQMGVGDNQIKARPTVTLQFRVEGNRIRTRVTNVNVGTMNVPRSLIQTQIDQLERTIEEQVNRAVTDALARTGLKVVNVAANANSLLVELGQ